MESGRPNKLSKVIISYDFDGNWERIEIVDQKNHFIEVKRESIEAFLRMQTILADIEEIQKLQERLNQIFPKKP